MNNENEWKVKRIIFVVTILLSVVLVVLYTNYAKKKDAEYKNTIIMKDELVSYQSELDSLEKQLDELKENINIKNEIGYVMIGFEIDDVSQISMISELATIYSFEPVFVINPSIEHIVNIMNVVRGLPYEYVMSVSPFDQASLIETNNIRFQINYEGTLAVDSKFFLLRNADEDSVHLDLIANSFYIGCFRFSDNKFNEVESNGLLCSKYSQIKSANTAITNRLNELVKNKDSVLFVFELSNEQMNREIIEEYLTKIDNYIQKGSMQYSTISTVENQIKNHMDLKEEAQEQVDAFLALNQARMDELKNKISEIRRKWKG